MFYRQVGRECDRPVRLIVYEVIETSCWRLMLILSKCCALRYTVIFFINNVRWNCSWCDNFLFLYGNVDVNEKEKISGLHKKATHIFFSFDSIRSRWFACWFFPLLLHYGWKLTLFICTLLELKYKKYFLRELHRYKVHRRTTVRMNIWERVYVLFLEYIIKKHYNWTEK